MQIAVATESSDDALFVSGDVSWIFPIGLSHDLRIHKKLSATSLAGKAMKIV